MKKYYWITGITKYDGLEFRFHYTCEKDKEIDINEVEQDINEFIIHSNTEEELESVDFIEISKEDYEVFRKFKI
jgi:hypothetical protein